ncbi:hypothetical protein [Bradyrhizobium zhanjiangense]|uniref:hypothetical protein n=1 Tax=Bradyrhizobium zhanjiangense TaxID=1325107 RepID=UPI0010099728|nr:hypothetical protein [Bradyrhizobium zhanjiangense]
MGLLILVLMLGASKAAAGEQKLPSNFDYRLRSYQNLGGGVIRTEIAIGNSSGVELRDVVFKCIIRHDDGNPPPFRQQTQEAKKERIAGYTREIWQVDLPHSFGEIFNLSVASCKIKSFKVVQAP